MNKARLLVWGDAVVATGFSKVLHSIVDNLPQDMYDIYWIGVNYHGDPHSYPYKIYPADSHGDLLGLNRLQEILTIAKPEIILALGDAWNLNQFLEALISLYENGEIPATFVYFPVDSKEHNSEWYAHFDKVFPVTYTKFGLDVASKARPDIQFSVIPHGVETNDFFRMDKMEARKRVFKKDPDTYMDKFIVLNANRNQPRKRLDITMKGFAMFAENKDDAVLYMHSGVVDAAINTSIMAHRLGIANKYVVTTRNAGPQQVPIFKMNEIYNSADIGINTSLGEGWGLCLEENTPIWSVDGIKRIKDMQVGDRTVTHTGEIKKVINVFDNGIKDLVKITFQNRRELKCTPEHLLMTLDGWKKAKDLTNLDVVKVFKPKVNQESLVVDLAEDRDLLCNDDFVWRREDRILPRMYKRHVDMDEDLGIIVGQYLASGKIKKGKLTIRTRTENDAQQIVNKFRRLGVTSNITFDLRHRPVVDTTDKTYVKFFLNNFGSKLRTRKVPISWFSHSMKNVLESFLLNKSRKEIAGKFFATFSNSTSSFIVHQLSINNYRFECRMRENGKGYFCSFRIMDLDTLAYAKVLRVEPYGLGHVYDLEVEEDHSYIANGYVVHNCNVEHACTGALQIVPDHSACRELFSECGLLIPVTMDYTQDDIMTEGGLVKPEDVAQALETAYTDKVLYKTLALRSYKLFTSPQYSWKNIAGIWHGLFQEALNGNNLADKHEVNN